MNDFLGCDILRNKDEKRCYLLQPHLINKLQRTFGKLREVRRDYATPGTPQKILHRVKPENEDFLKKEEMKKMNQVKVIYFIL